MWCLERQQLDLQARFLQDFCILSQVAILFAQSVRDVAIQIRAVNPGQPVLRDAKFKTKEVSSCNEVCYLYLAQFDEEGSWRLQQGGGNAKSGLTICGRGDKTSYQVDKLSSH